MGTVSLHTMGHNGAMLKGLTHVLILGQVKGKMFCISLEKPIDLFSRFPGKFWSYEACASPMSPPRMYLSDSNPEPEPEPQSAIQNLDLNLHPF